MGNQNRALAPTGWKWVFMQKLLTLTIPDNYDRIWSSLRKSPSISVVSCRERQTKGIMLQLTPLEQTVAGQEIVQIGLAQGREQGREQGRLIGEIQMAQRILKYPIASEKELAQKKMEELNIIFGILQKPVNSFKHLSFEKVE